MGETYKCSDEQLKNIIKGVLKNAIEYRKSTKAAVSPWRKYDREILAEVLREEYPGWELITIYTTPGAIIARETYKVAYEDKENVTRLTPETMEQRIFVEYIVLINRKTMDFLICDEKLNIEAQGNGNEQKVMAVLEGLRMYRVKLTEPNDEELRLPTDIIQKWL